MITLIKQKENAEIIREEINNPPSMEYSGPLLGSATGMPFRPLLEALGMDFGFNDPKEIYESRGGFKLKSLSRQVVNLFSLEGSEQYKVS
jgi:hypothetical protein